VLCVVRALLKKMQHRVLVGDWVALSSVEWTARRAMVTAPLPRSGPPLVDPPVANVQQLVLCFALADPPVEAVQLTRFLVSAEATGLPFVLVFNKADLGTSQRRQDVAEHMRLWGYAGASAPRFVSVATGEGTAHLATLLSGIVTAIAGPSGVGKSSLINMLRCVEGASNTDEDAIGAGGGNKRRVGASGGGASDWDAVAAADDEDDEDAADAADDGVRAGPAWEVQTVKAISGRSRRGRHTTRHVSLLRLPGGGLLADTPGFGLPSLDHVTTRELPYCFPEVRAALASGATCSFANCTHRDEPGCVARGEPTWERYPLYRELYEELLTRETAAARTAGKRESGVRTKANRGSGTQPRVEVKLTPHKHRRVNRTNANALLAGELGRLQQEDEAIAEDAAEDAAAAQDAAAAEDAQTADDVRRA
jgi:ribosome biogenesis GTPase